MDDHTATSPKWSSTTKLVVGLSFVAVIAALLIKFRNLIGPIILAFVLAYLFYPPAAWISKTTKISWRTAVTLIYLVLLILLLGLFTVTGLAIVQQLQSLLGFLQNNVTNLPELVARFSQQTFEFGPFQFSLAQYDLQALTSQLLSSIQPILGRAGSLISSLATSAAATVGWGLFILIISYFLLADAGRVSGELVHIDIPGYQQDIQRLGVELRNTWNAFLRGQLLIIGLVIIVYSILMAILGVRFAIGIAILAGIGRLVPYVGPLALWITTILVTYFQGSNYFGLEPIQYALLVVLIAFITDQIFDNIVNPRFMGQALGVHPAAVLIAAIIGANLIGLIGLILAGPSVATIKLLGGYIFRKMLDLDPWPAGETPPPARTDWKEQLSKIKTLRKRFQRQEKSDDQS